MSGLILSLEDIKKIADDYGYRLIKKPVKTPLKPCKCGYTRPEKRFSHDGVYYICPACHRRSDEKKTAKERKQNWNERV